MTGENFFPINEVLKGIQVIDDSRDAHFQATETNESKILRNIPVIMEVSLSLVVEEILRQCFHEIETVTGSKVYLVHVDSPRYTD